MKELWNLARALVDQPEKVVVNMIEKDRSILIELQVAREDG